MPAFNISHSKTDTIKMTVFSFFCIYMISTPENETLQSALLKSTLPWQEQTLIFLSSGTTDHQAPPFGVAKVLFGDPNVNLQKKTIQKRQFNTVFLSCDSLFPTKSKREADFSVSRGNAILCICPQYL